MSDGFLRYRGISSISLARTACTASFLGEITVSLPVRWVLEFALIFSSAADASRDMAASPFSAVAQQPGQPQDFNKLFQAERDNLEFAEGLHKWAGSEVENRILRKYGRIPAKQS